MPEPPRFIHDTRRIVYVNAEGCKLFRCDLEALVDLDMMQLIVNPDFRGLARLRMQMMREMRAMPSIKYKFLRCDGTKFWASVDTNPAENGLFETTLTYESEE